MQWHNLSPAIRVLASTDEGALKVELPEEGRGYIGFDRDNAAFSKPPETPAFQAIAGRTMHVSVETTVLEGQVQSQLCVICYLDNDREPRKYWSDIDSPALSFCAPNGITSASIALLVRGQGILNLHTPVISDGVSIQDWQYRMQVAPETNIHLSLTTRCTQAKKNSGLVTVQFLDDDNDPLLPSNDMPVNPYLGSYFYLDSSDANVQNETNREISVPREAASALFKGKLWDENNHITVLGEPSISQMRDHIGRFTLQESLEWLRELPSLNPLIVLYTTAPPVGHATLSLRPNRLAAEYRKLGIEVIFFPFGRITDEQRVTDEGVVQFNRTEMDQVNAILADRQGSRNVFICSSFPDIGALTTIDLLKASKWATMYEVRDEMEDFNRVGYSKWFDPELERQVINRVDRVVTVSPRLAEKMRLISRGTVEPVVVQNAAPPDLIERGSTLRTEEVVFRRQQIGIIGYIGHLTDSWFDWDLIIRTATTYPDFQFEIIGHGIPESIELPENIEYLGPKTHEEFVEISRRWVVGLIPFQETPLTYAVDPNKVYEYLAVGLRTVTAPMGSVATCPSTYIYERPEEFPMVLHRAITDEFTTTELAEINTYISTAGWESRAVTMLQIAGLERVL
ncbi:hypothetical protein [Kocuria carniphila]|uniref:hypothetical protein n=1 Tax=Kocuria carniphila TaxID=262208 RepID=UPI0034DB2029